MAVVFIEAGAEPGEGQDKEGVFLETQRPELILLEKLEGSCWYRCD